MKIVGVAGTNGSGKDTLGDVLEQEFGFKTVSLSDFLRSELTKLDKPHTRENLSNHSKLIRDKDGDGALVSKVISEHREKESNLCITSVRAPGEVDKIHEYGGVVVWVDADPKIRYSRIAGRARDQHTDTISFSEFMKQQDAEMTPSKQGGGLHLIAVKEKADKFIMNNHSSLNKYKESLRELIREIN